MNRQIEKQLKKFDKQIRNEYSNANGDKYKCQSYWAKMIFLESIELDIYDWRKIRSGNYLRIKDSLTGISKKKFTLKRIQAYKAANVLFKTSITLLNIN